MATKYYVDIETKQAEKNLKRVNDELDDLKLDLLEGERALNTWKNQLVKADKITPEMHRKTKQLSQAVADLRTKVKGATMDQKIANAQLKEAKEDATELTGSMKMLDKATGGAVTRIKDSTKAFGGLTKGVNGFRLALIASGIGLLVVAITSIVQAFKRSEEGQEKWERGMAMIGAVVNQVLDGLAGLGEWFLGFPKMVADAVMNPIETIKNLGSTIWNVIKDPLGSARKLAIQTTEAISDVVNETMKEVDAMNEVTKMRQKAHHIERDLIVERAEANRDISAIRLEAEKRDIYTAEQRIEMLKKAQKIEEDITNKEIKAKKLKVDALKKEMSLGLNNRQIKDDLAKLEAELITLDTKRTRSQRLLQTQITTATNQALAEKQKEIDEKKKMEEDYAKWQGEFELAMLSTEEEKHQRKLLQIDNQFNQKMEQARVHFENEMMTQAEFDEIERQLQQEKDDAKQSYNDSVAQKAFDKKKKENLRTLNEEEKLERNRIKAKSRSLNAIVQLAGAESKIGRMALIAKNLLMDKEMIMEAKKTISFSKSAVAQSQVAVAEGTAKTAKVGFPQNIPMLLMYAVQAVGIIGAIRKAVRGAKESTAGTGVGGSIPEPSTPSSPALASVESMSEAQNTQTFQPSFNTIGATQGNQIAQALGTQAPIQAYVVSQDVTTAQSLQNNIVSSASLG